MENLRKEARKRGLWNLWLTHHTAEILKNSHPEWPWKDLFPHLTGLSHHDYAFVAIETGRTLYAAEACNCNAPDTGNMEIIAMFGTKSQQQKYLLPLLDGKEKSCFGMTEPMTASSDPIIRKILLSAFTEILPIIKQILDTDFNNIDHQDLYDKIKYQASKLKNNTSIKELDVKDIHSFIEVLEKELIIWRL